jgi:hypothetical protein
MTSVLSKLLESDNLDDIFQPMSREDIIQRVKERASSVYVTQGRDTLIFSYELTPYWRGRERTIWLSAHFEPGWENFLWYSGFNKNLTTQQRSFEDVPLELMLSFLGYTRPRA